MSDEMHEAPKASIQHLPISIFAAVMGLAGLAIATSKLESAFGFANLTSLALIALAGLAWIVIAAVYLIKVVKFPEAVIAELNHPVRLSFFPTISIGLLLLSVGLVPHFEILAQLLWWIGSVIQFGLMLLILERWFHREHFKTEHNSPAWFIPIVGNMIVPLAGVEFGYTEISYFFFAIGFIFWLPLLAISLNRSFFFSPIPDRLTPTLFILIAPPAVSFIAWMKLHSLTLDDVSVITFYFALFTVVMLISQAKRFIGLAFGLPFWAFTFPLAAVTIAAFVFYEAVPQLHYLIIATSLFGVTALVVSYVSVMTVIHATRGKICLPE